MKRTLLFISALIAGIVATDAPARDKESRQSAEEAVVAAFSKICLEAQTPDASRQVVEAMKGVRDVNMTDQVLGDRYTYKMRIGRVAATAVVFRGRCDLTLRRIDVDALAIRFGALLQTLQGVEALPKVEALPASGVPTPMSRPQYHYVRWQASGGAHAATLEMSSTPILGSAERDITLYRGWREEPASQPASTEPPATPQTPDVAPAKKPR
jgi:hypothetical protein